MTLRLLLYIPFTRSTFLWLSAELTNRPCPGAVGALCIVGNITDKLATNLYTVSISSLSSPIVESFYCLPSFVCTHHMPSRPSPSFSWQTQDSYRESLSYSDLEQSFVVETAFVGSSVGNHVREKHARRNYSAPISAPVPSVVQRAAIPVEGLDGSRCCWPFHGKVER